ncbi:MAG: hypothetical protein RR444_00370, partial [Oscillospiraceae bacterium]
MKFRLNLRVKSALRIAAWVVSIPILYIVASKTMPYVEPLIERVAVYSASISFAPENKTFLETNINWNYDMIEDTITGISDNEIDIEYEETPTQEEVSSQTSSEP